MDRFKAGELVSLSGNGVYTTLESPDTNVVTIEFNGARRTFWKDSGAHTLDALPDLQHYTPYTTPTDFDRLRVSGGLSYGEYSGNVVVEEHPSTGGIKNDTGKPDLSLCPKVALEAMARAFMYGEKKYHRYNYLKGFDSHRLIGAALRHITSWQEGEDTDPESSLCHLGHALASIAMILDCDDKQTLTDTRFKK